MELRNRDFATRAIFDILPRHLEPYLRGRLRELQIDESWEQLFHQQDGSGSGRARRYELTDPLVQLKLLFYNDRTGNKVVPTSSEAAGFAKSLLKTRNELAHPSGPIPADAVHNILLRARSLFEQLGIEQGAAEVNELGIAFLRHASGRQQQRSTEHAGTSAPEPAAGGASEPARTTSPEPGRELPAEETEEPADDRPAQLLDSLEIEVRGVPSLITYAEAYNSPSVKLDVIPSGSAGAIPALRVGVSLVVGTQTITTTYERVVSLESGGEDHSTYYLTLDRTAMLDLEQTEQASVQVVLHAADSTRTVVSPPTTEVLGAHTWILAPDDPADLAAFVRPHQPAIARLTKDAAEILGTLTPSDALDAYQQAGTTPTWERTDRIVEAFTRAIHARGLTYANPPASWRDQSQTIRPADEILETGLGTCLDLTVLLAGSLEQAGIDTQLWLVPGHIFLAYWRDASEPRGGSELRNAKTVANHVDLGSLRFVETTMLASSPSFPGMDALHLADARKYLPVENEEDYSVVELAGARRAGVRPLPVRSRTETGQVVEVEYTQAARDLAALVREQIPDDARRVQRDKDVPARIIQWKRELLDLSLRNRLINRGEKAAIELAVPEGILGSFEDMLHSNVGFDLRPDNGLADLQGRRGVAYGTELDSPQLAEGIADSHQVIAHVSDDRYGRDLLKLANTARTIVQETGANNLYLALGTLSWESDGKPLRSPLVLVPVTIRARTKGGRYVLRLDDTGSSTPNHSLLERLRVDLGVDLKGLADPVDDGAGIDLDAVLTSVRSEISELRLPFRVEPTVHLGIFAFSGFRLWKDLEDDWRSIIRNPLVHHLVHSPQEPFEDPADGTETRDLDELVSVLPSSSDASQAKVVAEALDGRSMVVQGPPGTGKSQTITNLIVQAMVEGKRILFVAEKQAALEVVARRLDAAGVGDLVLNLHDEGQKPAAVKARIKSALDLTAAGDDEGLRTALRSLSSTRRELVQYVDAVHDRNPAGLSFYASRTLELAADDASPMPIAEDVVPRLTADVRADLERSMDDIADASRGIDRRPGHPWRSLGAVVAEDRIDAVADLALEIRRLVETTSAPLHDTLGSAHRPEHLGLLADLLRAPWITAELVGQIGDPRWEQAAGALLPQLDSTGRRAVPAFESFRPEVLAGPLDDVRSALTEARSALLMKNRRIRKAMAPLAPWEVAGPVDPSLAEQMVNDLIALRDETRHLEQQIRALPGFQHWGPFSVLHADARSAVIDNADWLRSHRLPRPADPVGPDRFRHAAMSLFTGDRARAAGLLSYAAGRWAALESALGAQLPSHDSGALSGLVQGMSDGRADEMTVRGLQMWNDLEHAVMALRRIGATDAAEAVLDGTVATDELTLSFQVGFAQASRSERALAGRLRAFDGPRHDQRIRRFMEQSETAREASTSVAASRVIAHRATGADASSVRKVSDLRRAVGGRSAPKIRTLISNYGDVISRLTPCVLVSPDSAARFIPSDSQLFDIVVFDEASQVTVANAVGAMGRGRSVVVVGDSKQMPPTRFAELTRDYDEDDEEELETTTDQESILEEAVQARVPEHLLSWHYRSRSESLIAFSNEKYYDGRLASFPGPTVAEADPGHDGFGVSMVRVDGQYLRTGVPRKELRTNPIEARAIVEDVRTRFEAQPDSEPSIGIVTFNIQQRHLIEALLRETGDERIIEALEAPEGVFVKNLENVQGDERDTILFSIAFSAGTNGQVPLNFGPLNRSGGERRLNVAVTRARKQIVVFCSFEPEQLRAERSASVGLKHLRDYLDLAKQGTVALGAGSTRSADRDRHREDVAAALTARGLTVQESVGLSGFRVDLAIADPDDPDHLLVAVLLDGIEWAHRGTETDRDVLPFTVLRDAAGWTGVERVWMPDWLLRRDEVIARIEDSVLEAQALLERRAQGAHERTTESTALVGAGSALTEPAPPEPDPAPETEDRGPSVPLTPTTTASSGTARETTARRTPSAHPNSSPPARVAGHIAPQTAASPAGARGHAGHPSKSPTARGPGTPFRAWQQTDEYPTWFLDQLSTSSDARFIANEIACEILEAEQPVQKARLGKLIANTFGLQRVRQNRIDAVLAVLGRATVRFDRDGFAWDPSHPTESPMTYRPGILVALSIDEVHPAEIRAAVAEAHRSNGFAEQDTVLRAALSSLGGRSLTTTVRPALEKAYRDVTAGDA